MSDGPVRRCPVCEHPSVLGINQAILNGKSYRAIARDYKIGSERSGTFTPDHKKVTRHAENCLETSYQQVQQAKLDVQGEALVARMREMDEHVDMVLRDAIEGDPVMMGDAPALNEDGSTMRRRNLRVILAAVREGRHNAALRAKLAGAMPDENAEALEHARQGLEDPEVRKLVVKMEELLAQAEAAAGRDKLDTA